MSDKPKRKDTTQISGLFTIGFEDLENGGLPGITQLLSPAAMKQKAFDRAKAEQEARDEAAKAEEQASAKPLAPTPPQNTSKPMAKFGVTEALAMPPKNVSITSLSFDSDEGVAAGTLEASNAVESKPSLKSPPLPPSMPKAPPQKPMPKPHAQAHLQAPPAPEAPPPVRSISELTALIKRPITQVDLVAQESLNSNAGTPSQKPGGSQGKPQVRIQTPPSELTMLINSGRVKTELKPQITSLEPSEIMEPEERPERSFRPEEFSETPGQQATQMIDISLDTSAIEKPILQTSSIQSPSKSHSQSQSQSAQNTQAQPKANAKCLSELGVQFELHFESERGMFRYARMKGHKRAVFALWQQKFYFQMKLDLKALGLDQPFQEFSKDKDEFYADAFGLIEANFVQVIRLASNPNKVYVLLSDHSLADVQAQVSDLLQGKTPGSSGKPGDSSGDSGDYDFVIELAS